MALFKYLGPAMIAENALMAGEESGGYAVRGSIPERDGILSGIMVLDMMVRSRKTLSTLIEDLHEKVGPHSYDRWDVKFDLMQRTSIQQRVDNATPKTLAGRKVEHIDTKDGRKFLLKDGFWSLIRFSGTEPLLRIYAEGSSSKEVTALLQETLNITGL